MAAMLNFFSLFHALLIAQVLVICVAAESTGFSVKLIHRDSHLSPLYNPSATRSERLADAYRRSFSRAAHLFNIRSEFSPQDVESHIVASSGEYLMKISIGTPAIETMAIADTGSDITWTQCKPCINCYPQDAPLFDPKKSSTYRDLSCESQPCQESGFPSCTHSNACQYQITYGDHSYSIGLLAQETFTFESTSGRPVLLPKLVFGCGQQNQGTFNESSSGIVGLGGGSLSLVSQLKDSINGKFSYCLVNPLSSGRDLTSDIFFGDRAVVSGPGVVSTPIIKNSPDTFYYLTLESISVGNKTFPTSKKSPSSSEKAAEEGNIIIDSGTTLTLLPGDLYQDLESELRQAIKANPKPDPSGLLSLCYDGNANFTVPPIRVQFTGAELELGAESTFVSQGDLVCLAMVPSRDLAIFGNLSQMNFLIGYDLENNKLSFKPTDCSKQ